MSKMKLQNLAMEQSEEREGIEKALVLQPLIRFPLKASTRDRKVSSLCFNSQVLRMPPAIALLNYYLQKMLPSTVRICLLEILREKILCAAYHRRPVSVSV